MQTMVIKEIYKNAFENASTSFILPHRSIKLNDTIKNKNNYICLNYDEKNCVWFMYNAEYRFNIDGDCYNPKFENKYNNDINTLIFNGYAFKDVRDAINAANFLLETAKDYGEAGIYFTCYNHRYLPNDEFIELCEKEDRGE